MEILTKAKVNLSIVINNILPNGYHEFESFVIFPKIYDKLVFTKCDGYGKFNIVGKFANFVPNNKDNIVLKTLELIYKNYNIQQKYDVTLHKNLPVGAGVGGGSANAAGVVKFFVENEIIVLDEKLNKIMLEIGCDVLMCFYEKSCIVRGVGEKIIPCDFGGYNVVLINDGVFISTPNVFEKFDQQFIENNINDVNKKITQKYSYTNFNENDNCDKIIKKIANNGNNMTDVACLINPNIQIMLNDLTQFNPILSGMSGSGGTVFGVFEKKHCVNDVVEYFDNKKYWVEQGGF